MWKINCSYTSLEISEVEMKPLGKADVYIAMCALLRFFQYLYFSQQGFIFKGRTTNYLEMIQWPVKNTYIYLRNSLILYRSFDIAKRNFVLSLQTLYDVLLTWLLQISKCSELLSCIFSKAVYLVH